MSKGFLPFTSLDAATATGPGTSRDLERVCRRFTLILVATGSPSNANVALEGSHDDTNWVNLTSTNAGATPGHVTVATAWVRYIRANLAVLTGGSSPTVTASIAVGDEEGE